MAQDGGVQRTEPTALCRIQRPVCGRAALPRRACHGSVRFPPSVTPLPVLSPSCGAPLVLAQCSFPHDFIGIHPARLLLPTVQRCSSPFPPKTHTCTHTRMRTHINVHMHTYTRMYDFHPRSTNPEEDSARERQLRQRASLHNQVKITTSYVRKHSWKRGALCRRLCRTTRQDTNNKCAP